MLAEKHKLSLHFRAKCNIHEPECIRGILINSAKHLGSLNYEIWNKMATSVKCGEWTRELINKTRFPIVCSRLDTPLPLPFFQFHLFWIQTQLSPT